MNKKTPIKNNKHNITDMKISQSSGNPSKLWPRNASVKFDAVEETSPMKETYFSCLL